MNKKYILIVMLFGMQHVQGSVASLFSQEVESLSDVLEKYEEALDDLLQVYKEQSPPLPIQFVSSDIVGSTFDKIIYPYVSELTGLASVVMSGFVRKYPYVKDLQIMHEKFITYQSKVKELSKKFPSKQQVVAMQHFYKQLVPVVQTCAHIVRGVTDALDTKEEDVLAAQMAFNMAWQAQTPKMKLTGFTDVKSFQKIMITGMVSLYRAAINKEQEFITNGKDVDKVLKKIASYYQAIERVYTTANDTQQAAFAKQNYTKASNNVQAFFEAEFSIKEADKKAEEGRLQLIIDFYNPADTKHALSISLESLQTATALYQQVKQLYVSIGYGTGVQQLQSKLEEIQADQHIRGIQLLWTMLLQDQYRSEASSSLKAFSQLKLLYQQDPTKHLINLDDSIKSLEQIIDLFTKVPNMFSSSLSLDSLIKGALQLYQAADSGHPDAASTDRLADMELLHATQNAYDYMVSIISGMVHITKATSTSSLLSSVGTILQQAQALDKLFVKEQLLKELCVYLPDLMLIGHDTKRNFVLFVMQYVYRLCMAKGMAAMKVLSSDKNDTSDILEAVTYFMFIQQYKQYLSSEEVGTVEKFVQEALQGINIQGEADKVYAKAQQNTDWKNAVDKKNMLGLVYQSSADGLWKRAIHIYEIALQQIPSIQLKRTYVTVLQNYIETYIQNVPKYDGYQLHLVLPLYKLYLGAIELNNDEILLKFVQNMSAQLFGKEAGFFGECEQLSNQITVSAKSSNLQKVNQQAALERLKKLLSMFDEIYHQDAFMLPMLQSLFVVQQEITSCMNYTDKGENVELRIGFGQMLYVADVINPQVVEVKQLEDQAEKLFDLAEQATIQQKFSTAETMYKSLLEIYSKIVQLSHKNSIINTYKQKMFLAKTRYAACNVAARIQFTGSQLVGSLSGVPEKYYVTQFQEVIDTQKLGFAVPKSLDTLQGKTFQKIITDEARLDALAVFKAFLIDKLLQQQGLNFKVCFNDYKLSKKSGLGKLETSLSEQAQKTVEAYMQDFTQTVIYGLVQGTSVVIKFEDMPLPPVISLYQGGVFAAAYLIEAATLFKPGKELVSVGGISYVPGQDQQATELMYEDVAYAYVVDAYKHLTQAQQDLQSVATMVIAAVKAGNKIKFNDISVLYDRAKKSFIRAQALLYATDSSAYYYFKQAKQTQKAQEVREYFLNTYKIQIDLLKQLLVGIPFSDMYTTATGDINQAYVSWNAELDINDAQDSLQIQKNREAIVQLYVTAAQNCMKYTYIDPMFPKFKQYHYMKAASNYNAAYKEYKSMQNISKAKSMMEKVLEADYNACNQNIEQYFSAKKDGVVYTPIAMFGGGEQKPKNISFDQLNRSYENFSKSGANINSGELKAYNTVKKLLLDASMFYQYLVSKYSTHTKKESAYSIKQQKMNPKLLAYLRQKNIIGEQVEIINYTEPGIIQNIFGLTKDLYKKFKDDEEVLVAWIAILNVAVGHLYIQDYLGASGGAQDYAAKWQEFFQAVKKEGSALQNPASEYVG